MMLGQGRGRHGKGHGHGRKKFFPFGFRRRHCCCPNPCASLNQCVEGDQALVTGNPDKKTRELGIFCGVMINVIKNDDGNANMIIGVGDARYAIAKEVAKLVCVKVNREDY
ncbi:FeoA family protein [Verrucomicrobiota bacterium]